MSQAVRQEEALEAATREAVEAADHGRWDEVADRYRQRGEALAVEMPSVAQAQRLVASDLAVMEKARVAKLAILQSLTEIAALRHRMRLVKELAPRSERQGAHFDRVV